MILLYRDLFILICLGLLIWGMVRVERIYQYPFFMGSMFFSFILPQVFALIDNPGILNQETIERVLLMSCLCAVASWIGYQLPLNTKLLNKLDIKVDDKKLFFANTVLMGFSLFFYLLMARSNIQQDESAGGNWTGAATIYIFFARLIYIAFAFFLIEFLKRPTLQNLIFVIISGWMPIQAVLGGRRQPTMSLLVIIGISLWIVYRLIPPRWLVIIGVMLSLVLIPLIGRLRGNFWDLLFAGQWDILFSTAQITTEKLQEGEILELKNAAIFMDVTSQKGLYGLGAGWWDNIIFQYVPGQIVGRFLKNSLQFNLVNSSTVFLEYGYEVPSGTTLTGIGDSFIEFGYLGCLIFAILGYAFKYLWFSSVFHKSILSILLYTALLSPAMVGLTHGIGRFWQEMIIKIVVIYILVRYSKKSLGFKSNTNIALK